MVRHRLRARRAAVSLKTGKKCVRRVDFASLPALFESRASDKLLIGQRKHEKMPPTGVIFIQACIRSKHGADCAGLQAVQTRD
jgi:hypothetical protein